MGATPQETAAYFGAAIEDTYALAISDTSAPLTEQLREGRYLLMLRGTTGSDWVWVKVGKFVAGTPIVATTGAGPKVIPLNVDVIPTFEFNVVRGVNDGLAVIAESAISATLYVCMVSRKV